MNKVDNPVLQIISWSICFVVIMYIVGIFGCNQVFAKADLILLDKSGPLLQDLHSSLGGLDQCHFATGDFNGDTYMDLVYVDAYFVNYHGRITFFYGREDGKLFTEPTYVYDQQEIGMIGSCIKTFNINNDGVDDLIVGDNLYGFDAVLPVDYDLIRGRILVFVGGQDFPNNQYVLATGGSQAWLGYNFDIGDINGDGRMDLVSGGFLREAATTPATIYFFSEPFIPNIEPLHFLYSPPLAHEYGEQISILDINADGYDDILIGSSNSDVAGVGVDAGKVFVYYGGEALPTTESLVIPGEQWEEDFGICINKIGDINGDGLEDVSITAEDWPNNSGIGRSEIYLSSNNFDGVQNFTLYGESTGGYFGSFATGLGDLDNDGFNEFAISGRRYSSPTQSLVGRVYIYKGAEDIQLDSNTANADWILTGENAYDRFSIPIAIGDYNKNHYTDFIVIALAYPSGVYNMATYLYEIDHGIPLIEGQSPEYITNSSPVRVGLATDSEKNISRVEWSFDNDIRGEWELCIPNDGSFDNKIEEFSCQIHGSELSEGIYTVYYRSIDENGVYMPKALYTEDRFIVDMTPPTKEEFNSYTSGINVFTGLVVGVNPYIIKVKAVDNLSGVERVEFFIDEGLVCTDTEVNSEGLYECAWDTVKYHTDIRVVMYDRAGNVSEFEVLGVEVSDELTRTGDGIWLGIILSFIIFFVLRNRRNFNEII